MVLDASAIVAILAEEPGALEIEKRLDAAPGPHHVSPMTRFEAVLALARAKSGSGGAPPGARPGARSDTLRAAAATVDAFLAAVEARPIAIDEAIGAGALDAAARYGRAVGHPAALNFGDCFAYACAKALGVSLLYKGEDFARTDLG